MLRKYNFNDASMSINTQVMSLKCILQFLCGRLNFYELLSLKFIFGNKYCTSTATSFSKINRKQFIGTVRLQIKRISDNEHKLAELPPRKPAAAAKLLQSCLTLCNPIDGSPSGSPVLGILQARTRVGCHFLLQCMQVKSESEVAQSCPTLSDPMDCSPPGSSVHGIFQARVLEWGAIAFSAKKAYRGLNLPHQPRQAFCGWRIIGL